MTRSATPTPAPLVIRGALQAFTRRLVEQCAPEKVILFGSLAGVRPRGPLLQCRGPAARSSEARPARANRACSPARSAPSSSGSARRTASSGERRIFSGWRQRTCDRPQVFRAAVGAAAAERFHLIDALAPHHSVSWLCRQLGVTGSGYYTWRQRQEAPGKRAAENAQLTAEIQAVFQEHRGFYGSPRIHQELAAAGLRVGRHRVARLMRRAELLG